MEDIKTSSENTEISQDGIDQLTEIFLDEADDTTAKLVHKSIDIPLDEADDTIASLLGVLCADQRLVYRTDVAALLARLGIQLSFIPLNEADAKLEVRAELTRLGIQ